MSDAEAEYAAVRLLVEKWSIPEREAERLLEDTEVGA
jgi:hypothetical protein